MRFGVLGPVEVWDGQRRLAIGGPQQRGLLAVLLLHANRVVSADRLVDHLWGDDPPATARGLLQGCVAGLRRALRHTGADRLETAPPGYRLRVAPDEFDVERFERLATEAGGHSQDPVRAAELLTEALSLWRGPALDGVELASCRAEAARLEERRLSVLEQRIDLDLRLGRQAGLVAELRALVAVHPLRERLWGQLMRALYEVDRRADALDTYQRLRRTLVEQLGVEPAASIQQLHRTILAGDDPPAGAPPAPAKPDLPTRPAQLPAPATAFAGRREQLKRLDELLGDTGPGPRVATISGMAGVGKTALAIHWAHRARPRFPDGQLYANLRGYASPPMRPIEALAGFLHALGVPADRVPADLEQAAALYRSLLADRQVLVMLDNAASIEQVRPLLPGGEGCLVLVTTRELLGGLVAREGAHHIGLDVLDPGEAYDLLAQLLGPQRAHAEAPATAALARLCAYLPLALRIAAANLILQPRFSIAAQVAELAAGDRLSALAVNQDEQAAVRTAFDQSYAALPAEARRLFRLLGLVPGPHVTAESAAALTGTTPGPAARLLARLASGHLLDQPAPDRYTLHDLVRLYAADRVHREDTVDDRAAATNRLFDWYLRTADAAARLLAPDTLRLRRLELNGPVARFDDRSAALAWLEAERPNLLAIIDHTAAHGAYPVAYHLADALQGFYWLRMYPVEWLAVSKAGLAAARAGRDTPAEVAAERGLGNVYMRRSQHQEAAEHYQRALRLSEQVGWLEAQAAVLNGLGTLYRWRQRLPEAADCYRRALALNREIGWESGLASNLGNLAIIYGELGQLQQAADSVSEALILYRQLGSAGKEAHGLGVLGAASHLLGRFTDAEAHLTRAIAMTREVGDRGTEMEATRILAGVLRDAGRYSEALALAEATLAAARDIGERRIEPGVLATLGTIHHCLGRYATALDYHEQALAIAVPNEAPIHDVQGRIGAAAALWRLDRIGEATGLARRALDLARSSGYRVEEGSALTILAAVDVAAGRIGDAVRHAEQAVAIQRDTGHRLGEARARWELGNARHRRGEPAAAIVSWQHAYTLLVEIGSPEAEQLRALAGCG